MYSDREKTMEIKKLVEKQKEYFQRGVTLSYGARMRALCTLEEALNRYTSDLEDALYADLHKSKMESHMTEIGLTRSELKYCRKHLRAWMAKEHIRTDLANFHSSSFTIAEPYGVTLVMAPWNYPVLLCLEPVINALAAGNTVVLKPSAYAPHVSAVLSKMIKECFPKEYVAVVEGGREENEQLLEQRFDYIFFTGGVTVGRLVLEKAARFITPVTLELGGKSPCIVDKTANIKIAARRIIFGKILNSGQTCVAPDYILAAPEIKDELFACMKQELSKMLGEKPLENPDYPRMVNEKHYHRVMNLINGEQIIAGGYGDEKTLQIAPTILDHVTFESPVMKEEIFGPVLPVMCFHSKDELLELIQHFEKPLACYLFTRDRKMENWALQHIPFGGGCINDTVVHLATSRMGFGGVGASGMGSYHGKVGFETFSHRKSILKKHQWIDVPVRYHPYNSVKKKLVNLLLG